jgi:hypothetical protein
MGYAVDAISKIFGAAPKQPTHLIDFFPVPLAMIVFAKLPHAQ